ncbi:MAG TPA: PepSY domain-containing protein [Planococcus sp. (in: firmicutes)]|nr:PepSY domain-containing protein [Planococcus sp. (in: firmicutes)]
MTKRITMSLLTIALAAVILFFLFFSNSTGQDVTLEEASTSVIELYGGEVIDAAESGNQYLIDFIRANGHYTATVNKETGRVESMELIESIEESRKLTEDEASTIAAEIIGGTVSDIRYEEPENEYEVTVDSGDQQSIVILSADTGEVQNVSTTLVGEEVAEESEPERVISRDEAVAIARTVLSGEVDDLEFHQTDDGGFYLVEIENDDTDQEVLVQIHAIRGEILTVEWDD